MKTTKIISVLNVIAWIIFIGSCVKAGALAFSFIVTIVNPDGAKNLYEGLNLYELYQYNINSYKLMMSSTIFLAGYKAYLAFLVVQIFQKINLAAPFSETVMRLITKISYSALAIGILSLLAMSYSEDFIKKGIQLSNINDFIGFGSEYLFFGGIIFIIAQVFKRGIEIQSENDLTI
ncbi:DUF2975 domain-containing protein [Chryseobacterium lactis]|uniref:DUF2975 domain-containing protein n=1 Tax=Chryseobacterium lactis TaxID=1241981 RepID=A0A3G6RKP7_CHRLC|nr:DUF2975 domain-containing protein [Chryseobacterium lactis]AZA83405.1 DUF2975 domain-containing protein [Chryseobacterium lactis]AZB03789.1 DUF2975 domain-containing protein [Chryseobacterium lactis]PNW11634.1 DUF2975 domain-containing protein [Chryseobacterium lactis]